MVPTPHIPHVSDSVSNIPCNRAVKRIAYVRGSAWKRARESAQRGISGRGLTEDDRAVRGNCCKCAVWSRREFAADGALILAFAAFQSIVRRISGLPISFSYAGVVGGLEVRPSLPRSDDGENPWMADGPHEYLVILESHLADQTLARLKALAIVTQVLRPRLLLIRADAKAEKTAARIAGVLGLYQAAPSKLPLDLTAEERLFVSAWEARRQPKSRPGDSLPWDAPGFVPPDSPRHRPK